MDWTLILIGTLTTCFGILSFIIFGENAPNPLPLKKGRELMLANTFLRLPIETVDSVPLDSTDDFQVTGPGALYCGWCLHDIRLVSRTKTGVTCADCGQYLDIASSSVRV